MFINVLDSLLFLLMLEVVLLGLNHHQQIANFDEATGTLSLMMKLPQHYLSLLFLKEVLISAKD